MKKLINSIILKENKINIGIVIIYMLVINEAEINHIVYEKTFLR